MTIITHFDSLPRCCFGGVSSLAPDQKKKYQSTVTAFLKQAAPGQVWKTSDPCGVYEFKITERRGGLAICGADSYRPVKLTRQNAAAYIKNGCTLVHP